VFQKDGLLIIVFDEADTLDFTAGGGHVATSPSLSINIKAFFA
jgi:hypothetical protein